MDNNKDLLVDLISKSNLTPVELRKNIYSYFNKTKEIDIVLVKILTEEIINGKFNSISDEAVQGLIKLFNGVVIEEEKKEEVKANDLIKLQEMYNNLVIENKKQAETIRQLSQQIAKLEANK